MLTRIKKPITNVINWILSSFDDAEDVYDVCCAGPGVSIDPETGRKRQRLSEDFIRNHDDLIIWECITKYPPLSDKFINEYWDKISIKNLIQDRQLSEQIVQRWINDPRYVNQCTLTMTKNIFQYQRDNLSEDFIDQYTDQFDSKTWNSLLFNRRFSEKFLRKHQGRIDWDVVATTQDMSYNFISEFIDRLPYNHLKFNAYLHLTPDQQNALLVACQMIQDG